MRASSLDFMKSSYRYLIHRQWQGLTVPDCTSCSPCGRFAVEVRKELYIGGRWVAPESSGDDRRSSTAGTEEVMGSVPRGGAAEVEQAVAAARTAFPVVADVRRRNGSPRCARSPTAWKRAPSSSPS